MQQGDWVQVWAQVSKVNEPGVHPEDVLVEFFSHSEQWQGHVRLDRVIETDKVPDFAGTCTHMHNTNKGAYRRCVKHDRHGGNHRDNKDVEWDSRFTVGYFEES